MSDAEAIADLGARMAVLEKAIQMLYADVYRDRPDHKAKRLADLKAELSKASRSNLGSYVDEHAKIFAAEVMAREPWDQDSGL